MNNFIYAGTILFLLGALAWNSKGWLDLFIKFVLWIMTFVGVVLSLQLLGYVVKVVK